MILGIAIALLTLIIDLWTDVKRWYDKRKVNHARGAVLRCIGLIPACWLCGVWVAPIILTGYWVIFNGTYNRFIGLNWFYRGTTSWLDRHLPVWVPYLALAGSIALYIIKTRP